MGDTGPPTLLDIKSELRDLRRGDSLAHPQAVLRLSTRLQALLLHRPVDTSTPDTSIELIDALTTAIDRLAPHQRLHARVDFNLDPDHSHPTLTERQESLATQLACNAKTIRRHTGKALDALAFTLTTQPPSTPTRRAAHPHRSEPATSDRELRSVEFVSWLADHSDTAFDDVYRAVALQADQLAQEVPQARHARQYRRRGVSRADLAEALATYYELPDGQGLYRVEVDDDELTLSVLTDPAWLNTSVRLRTSKEHLGYDPGVGRPVRPGDVLLDAAITRLAEVEVTHTVMVNSPIYRLKSLDFGPNRLDAQVTLSDYASYALTSDLMELELVDAVAANDPPTACGHLPIRDRLMPSIESAKSFPSRHSAGGPASLLAIARPARHDRPPDYALLIQERSGRVLNAAGRLAVIPKAFHQPIGEPAEEALLSTTLTRELEEELLGRQDLEQLTADSRRQADLLHPGRLSEPLAWLLDQPDETFRTECTGFGINLVTGTYEFACLIVIDDETWWKQWGHRVEANREAKRVHRYSSRDTNGLAALVKDPRWSNEGLFAFLEGLRRLNETVHDGRVTCPTIGLLEH